MKILTVDDEIVQLKSLRIGLRTEGHEVISALNAEDALKQLNEAPDQIDLILTDYLMAGANGLDLLKAVREKNKTIPVIMMTAYGEKELVVEAMKNHCDGFVDKPFTLTELIAEIERVRYHRSHDTHSHMLYDLFPKVVHQLNNPLMVIRGYSELGLLDLEDPAVLKKDFEAILEATNQIKEINTKILSLGKIAIEDREETDIKGLLEDCLGQFSGLMDLKKISLEKQMEEDPVHMFGNRFGLQQIFRNLIVNAIESMIESPQKELRVITELDPAASMVCIHIEDTGCGIPEAFLKRNPSSWTTTKKTGTGLGLRVVRDLLDKHNGRLEIKSQQGEGTTISVILPVMK